MGILARHDLQLEQVGIIAISSALLELHIQGLAQADRMLALDVLLQLLKVCISKFKHHSSLANV